MPVPCVPAEGSFDMCDDPGVVTVDDETEMELICGSEPITVPDATTCTCSTAPTNYLTIVVRNGDSGAAVENAHVKIAGTEIMGTTDVTGTLVLTIPAFVASPVVQVTKNEGNYLPTSKPVTPTADLIVVYLFEVAAPIQIDPTVENVVSLSDTPSDSSAGAVTLHIPAGAFYTASGSAPVGPVDLSVNFVQPSEDIGVKAPGVFFSTDESGNVVPIETMGVFALTARDTTGEALFASGISVSVGSGFRLFVLREDGTWQLEPIPEARRRRRQATSTSTTIVGQITINTDSVTWYNIDKFPENTRCWFKTYIQDTTSGTEVLNDALTRKIHNFVAVSERTDTTSILQLSDSWYIPPPVCFEVRCDNDAVNAETPSIPTGIITADVLRIIQSRATPLQLSDYHASVQSRLSAIGYTPEVTDRVRMQLESSADGPFFTDIDVCEAASFTDGGNVLGFTIAMPSVNTDPFGTSPDRCVARAKITLVYGQPGDEYGSTVGPFNALSVWGHSGQYYIGQHEYVINTQTQTIMFCFFYRCSEVEDTTRVTVSMVGSDSMLLEYTSSCDIRFDADIITSTGGGYFFNGVGDASAALGACAMEADDSLVVIEQECPPNRPAQ